MFVKICLTINSSVFTDKNYYYELVYPYREEII